MAQIIKLTKYFLDLVKVFRSLFPPSVFADFIDVGHYVAGIRLYRALARKVQALPRTALDRISRALDGMKAVQQGKDQRVIQVG